MNIIALLLIFSPVIGAITAGIVLHFLHHSRLSEVDRARENEANKEESPKW